MIVIISIMTVVILILAFCSPITKFLIQKYDENFLGRKITLDWAYTNPFTGYVRLNNVKVYEKNSDSVFFSARYLSLNFSLTKLFSQTYEISEMNVDHPIGYIIQDKKELNFSDIISRFAPDTTILIKKQPVHFNLLNFQVTQGEFHYLENVTPVNYFIKEVNYKSSGIRWDTDTTAAEFSFLAGIGTGEIHGNYTINIKTNDYRLAFDAHQFDLTIIEQYMKALSNYGTFSASLEASINATGNLDDEENLNAKGFIEVNKFHFGKSKTEDYASFENLKLSIIQLSPKGHKYLFDSISISHPYFKYERYDILDNLETMFGKQGGNITTVQADPERFNLILEIARYVKILARNFLQSDYSINNLAVTNARLKFNDYSISEKFSATLSPLTILADSINNQRDRVYFKLNTGIIPYGDINVSLSISPKDSADFDMNYHFTKMAASMFNPYTISYTSFPLDRGTIELNGIWHVNNGNIHSENHLLIIDPRLTKRLRNKDNEWLPVPLIMAFVRERGNVIDYEIPISGNLKNPKFHLHDVILDLLENIFVKPSTTPYRLQVKNTEKQIEKSLTLKWEMRQHEVTHKQEMFIERMAEFLDKNQEASIQVTPMTYSDKEKEYILFYEAKKKYYLAMNDLKKGNFSESDSEKVNKMSVKDSLFVDYLNKQINDSMVFTIQEKCTRLVNPSQLKSSLNTLLSERESTFMNYFKEKNVDKRVRLLSAKNEIPYNGFSYYKIEYKGTIPDYLMKAYQQMVEFNENEPRSKFQKERKESKTKL